MENSKNSRSTDFLSQFQKRLSRHVKLGQSVCVALSGGIDSVVLLHVAALSIKLFEPGSLLAIHVNHGLSDNAECWEEFCRELCHRLGIRYRSRRVKVRS